MDKNKLESYIKRLGEAKILVVGDLALDEMVENSSTLAVNG